MLSSSDDSRRSSRTLLLSAVLSGVRLALYVHAVIAGTGFSLALEYRTLRSQMALGDAQWAYVDFPLLTPKDVHQMLHKRLNLEGQNRVNEAAHWLAGRPRFAATFIERLLKSGDNVDGYLDQYLTEFCTPPDPEKKIGIPGTPGEAFAKLRTWPADPVTPLVMQEHLKSASSLPASQTYNEAYFIGLQDAFHLTSGLLPQIRENALLSDLDIAYIVNVVRVDRDPQVEIKMEPLVLEAAVRHIARFKPELPSQACGASLGLCQRPGDPV